MHLNRHLVSGLLICHLLAFLAFAFNEGAAVRESDMSQLKSSFERFHADNYQRPFGDSAPWNAPVADLPRHPNSDRYVKALWQNRLWSGAKERHQFLTFKLSFEGYTYPVFDAAAAAGPYPLVSRAQSNWQGQPIPWNPTWMPARGTDKQVIVIDSATGREWDMWQVRFDQVTRNVHATRANLVQATVTARDGSQPGDFRTKENGFRPSRGIGIQYLAMLVRPEEIMQGAIRHALSMPIRNPSEIFAVPPATKLEHPGDRSGVPEGMRFALDVSDTEIEQWLDELPNSLPFSTRYSARVIARALRDYGWFVTDTSGRAHLQFEDRSSAGEKWATLGLYPIPNKPSENLSVPRYPDNLLDGLISPDRIYAIVPSDQYPE